MISLFLLTLAGIAARLKPTVTKLLQAPLQGLRAPARVGDTTASTPPHALRPLRTGGWGLLGCLCMLTLLAVLALPMQTAAHTTLRDTGDEHLARETDQGDGWWQRGNLRDREGERVDTRGLRLNDIRRGHGAAPTYLPGDIINWIRVYKNPETVEADKLAHFRDIPFPVYDFSQHGLEGRVAPINQSLYADGSTRGPFWVKFDPDTGYLFEDETRPDKSGLVTATDNTSVKVGDIVAIAVNIKSWGGICTANLAIGERRWREVEIARATAHRYERRWRLNPNLALIHYGPHPSASWLLTDSPVRSDVTHTLVYQFTVTPDHAWLNTDGPWLKLEWTLATETLRVTAKDTGDIDNDPGDDLTHFFPQYSAFDWVWGEDKDFRPSDTTVSPFNCFGDSERLLGNWGANVVNTFAARVWMYATETSRSRQVQNSNQKTYTLNLDGQLNHRHIPMYDPALSGKEPIFYPKIELADTPATTAIEVPGGTQTGAFTVTLSFADESGLFEGHDFSAAGVAAFKTALTEKLSAAGWTVTSLTSDTVVASSGEDIIRHGESARYTLTLSPPLGAKDAVELQIPADTVMDAAETGNLAASVMVEVDAPLRLAEGKAVAIAEPEGDAYLAGDALEVLVPFAEAGLTYAGEVPPYLTIYLGAGTENPRHATWQKGEESAGSTIVPFKYTIAATDPIVSSVRVDTDAGVMRPAGTTLMNSAAHVWVVGTAAPAMGSGEKAPVPAASDTNKVSLATSTGETVTPPEAKVQVLPAVYLPPTEESAPKAGMSSIPRSPIVFNELGNGSGDTNDWLELRNVTGDAVSLKEWELSVVQDGKKEDTSLVVFPDVSVPAEGLLLLTNSSPTAEGNLLAGGDDIATAKAEVKGSSHLYLVNAGLSLPDDGQFLLILRKAKEKRGLNEAFVDVAGGGGSGTDAFVREQEGDYDTYVWPLQVLEAPGDATEDSLSSGKVWLRAKADIVGYHRDAWAEAAFTGVGYDRKVTKSAETAGTPGYPNGAVKTEAATPRGAITISEVMLDSAGGTLPQWVELYNSSKTDALNINRWELEIQNVDSEDLVGRPVVRLTLQEKVIQPNQTLLIVTGNARASSENVYPADRVYNLLELHDKNLRIKKPSDTFLSARGFYLRLTDRNEHLVDEVGNTDGNRRTDDNPAWALPVPLSEVEGMRSSLIRRYDKGVARDGKEKSSWALAANFAKFKAAELHYGHADDIGTPGYRQGGALPVELSSFTVTRLESGSVIVTWTTESEVDNAGFNLRRSLTRDGGFTLLNPALIAGAGTTGERQTYTYIDTSAKPGVEHYYQIEEVSFGGKAETLVTRRLRGPVSPAHRALKTLGEVKQAK